MVDNLIAILKSQIPAPILEQIAKLLGVDVNKAGDAIGATAGTLLAGLLKKASSPGGADEVFGLIQKNQPSGDIFSQLPDILGSPEKRAEMERKSTDVAGQVFGPGLGDILGSLGQVLGLAKGVLGPLMSLIVPLLMSSIGKQILSKGLNPAGLLGLLVGQKDFLKGVLPPDVTKAMGVNSLADLGSNISGAGADAARRAAEYGTAAVQSGAAAAKAGADEAAGLGKVLLPLLGLVALGLLGLFLLKNLSPAEGEKPAAGAPAAAGKVDEGVAENPAPIRGTAPDAKASVDATKDAIAASVETKDLVDTAVAAGNFGTLARALEAAGLVEALKGAGPFTVFAPTDEAFAKLPPGALDDLLKPENKAKLADVLKFHVLEGKVPASEAIKLDGQKVKTLLGAEAPIAVVDGKVKIGDATVTKTDIETSNGVIHVIDAVILPPAQ